MHRKKDQKIFSYYDERTQEYDEIYLGKSPGIPEPKSYKNDVEMISEICSRFGKGNLIDIGCGTGFWLPYYAKNCSRITLIDQSENMLSECRKRVEKLRLNNKCNFVQKDFFEISFEDFAFESALIGFVISHFSLKQEKLFFEKVKRILKPKAQLLLIDSAWTKIRKKHRKKEGIQERNLNNGRKFTIYKRYFDKSDIKRMFEKYGFTLKSIYFGNVFLAAMGEPPHQCIGYGGHPSSISIKHCRISNSSASNQINLQN